MTYHWLHIPTGERGTSENKDIHSFKELYRMLAKWNAQQPGVWQYWL